MSEPSQSLINTNFVRNYQTAEYGKFVELLDTKYPAISVNRLNLVESTSSVDVYPKYAVLTHISNTDDIKISLSAENINVSLDSVEALIATNNAIGLLHSSQLSALQTYTDDLEKNTFDTASACDDIFWETKKLNKVFTDSANLDAFGRFRVSQPFTIFDTKSIYDKGRYFWNSVQKDGSEVFNSNDSSRTASITADGGYFIKETYRRFAYQPGKSQLVLFTGILNAEENVLKRVGTFRSLSANDYTAEMTGIYFQAYKTTGMADNLAYAWVINNGSNLVPSQSAVQASWNIDKMDGSGPSGVALDFTKSQIFVIDFEWLGVGRVRFGFNIDGVTYYCHQVLNANNINGTYLKTPNNPLRAEIRSTGASSGTMKTICASIMSEGGADPSFVTRSVSTSTIANVGTDNRRGILGIRLDPARTNSVNEIIDISTVCNVGSVASTGPYKVELVLRPAPVSGVTWLAANDNSSIQYANVPAGVVITGGTVVVTELAANNTGINLGKPQYDKVLKLGRNLQGIPDECWLVVTPLVNMNGIYGAITFAEAD